MSWQTEIPIIVRTLINDWEDQPVYSDERLTQVIVVAAKYVQIDVNLPNAYIIDISNPQISPDPIDSKDDIFIGMVALKSACMMDQSSLRTKAAMEGIRAALGPASLSVGGSLQGINTIIEKGPCALYKELKDTWNISEASNIRAILSPFVGNNFDPRGMNMQNYSRYRDFYS
jgi:hypothetical protein